jgi:mannose-6-phosphate isomerase
MYVSAGDLHAYLEGSGIELMANSDNVLRGGLTPKYIDVRELLHILNFKPRKVDLIRPEKGQSGEGIYTTTTEEFRLSVIDLTEGSFFLSPRRRSVEIMICVEGKARIIDLGIGDSLALGKGTVIMIPSAVDQYRIEGTAFIYKAGVPL